MMLSAFFKLHKHTKIAICVAPMLMILGFVLSDAFLHHKDARTQIFKLVSMHEPCNMLNQKCQLGSGDLRINLYLENDTTRINSNYPLDSAILFIVEQNNDARTLVMNKHKTENGTFWAQTPKLQNALKYTSSQRNLRFIGTINERQYIADFIVGSP